MYSKKLSKLLEIAKTQPEQRTKEWYEARNKCLTASSIAVLLPLTQHEIDLAKQGIVKLPGSNRVWNTKTTHLQKNRRLRSFQRK